MRIEGLSFGYGIDPLFEKFTFSSNDPIAIFCGRTGCGKTTLLKLLARFLSPHKVDLFDVPNLARMVLQEDALFPWLTARENLSITSSLLRPPPNGQLTEPIAHLLDRPVFQLSFGQRRLVEICRALINAPPLLCLDEPFNFLDPAARKRMASLIQLVASGGCQVILTTHHLEDIRLLDAPVFRFPEPLPIRYLLKEELQAQ